MSKRIQWAVSFAAGLMILVIGLAAGNAWGSSKVNVVEVSDRAPVVDCPTEDSCTVDYRDGGWHIEPDVP